jgi:hypothetical protein
LRSEDEIRDLRERLELSERYISDVEQKHENDVEMYLKMLADTRCQCCKTFCGRNLRIFFYNLSLMFAGKSGAYAKVEHQKGVSLG